MKKMSTPNAVGVPTEKLRTTSSGTDLETFDDVRLYKEVSAVPPVTNVQDALSRLNNDHATLMDIIHSGLEQKAIEDARKSNDGWMLVDDEGKDTGKVFSGSLAPAEIVNPVILQFAKMAFGYDEASAAKDSEGRRKAKDAAKAHIKGDAFVLTSLKKKAAAMLASGKSEN